MLRRLTQFFAVACAALLLLPAVSATPSERTAVVVLFDAFSPFMMEGVATPNLDRMAREGTSSRHLIPSFPSLSMVNHTSFETGCWPEHHGIVANEFRDPLKGWYAGKVDRADAVWRTGCESMWQAAERQGTRAAVFNFVGRFSSTSGKQASVINDEVPWAQHEDDDTILAKATAALNETGAARPRLIVLYFDYPDSVAHGDGVHGEKTKAVIAKVDAVVGKLMDVIKASGREATLVVGADHGMTAVEKVINIGKLRQLHHFEAEVAYGSGSAMLYLKPGTDAAKVAKDLSAYREVFQVYRKGHFPPYAHLGTGPRVGDLLLVTRPPYIFEGPEEMKPEVAAREENISGPPIYEPKEKWFNSRHGFTLDVEAMHGAFFAWGAGIKPGKVLPRLEMIDVAPSVLHLIGLKPGQGTDGKTVELGK